MTHTSLGASERRKDLHDINRKGIKKQNSCMFDFSECRFAILESAHRPACTTSHGIILGTGIILWQAQCSRLVERYFALAHQTRHVRGNEACSDRVGDRGASSDAPPDDASSCPYLARRRRRLARGECRGLRWAWVRRKRDLEREAGAFCMCLFPARPRGGAFRVRRHRPGGPVCAGA